MLPGPSQVASRRASATNQAAPAPVGDMDLRLHPSFRNSVGSSNLERKSSRSSFASTRTMSTRSSLDSSNSIPSTPVCLEHQPPFPQPDRGRSSIMDYRPRSRHSSRHRQRGSRFYYAKPVGILKRSDEDDIDALDLAAFVSYHHEGPYDAAAPARNMIPEQSPMLALGDLNPDADTKQRSHENSINGPNDVHASDEQSHPPPGALGREGRVYEQDDGSNTMFDVMCLQAYKFTDEDFKNDPFYNDRYPKTIKELQDQLVKFGRRLKPKSRLSKV